MPIYSPNASNSRWQQINQSGAFINSGNSWAFSSGVSSVNFTGLGDYAEIYVIVRDIILAVSGVRQLRVSVDGGASYISSSDYQSFSNTGTLVAQTSFGLHNTASTTSRSASFRISGLNVINGPKLFELNNFPGSGFMTGSPLTNNIDAFQIFGSAGGNITGGTIDVFALI